MENFQEVKMGREDNADPKWGKKMEADESVRTVDCLRGRLLAERLASRNANMEAEQLGAKLMELENHLKQEAKSRNRAEKKLRFLMKKLQSMNISHVDASDESEYYSGLGGKSVISSPSSTASSLSSTQESKQDGKSEEGPQNLHPKIYDDNNSSTTQVSSQVKKGQESEDFEKKNVAQIATVENFMFSEGDADSEKSSHLGSNQGLNDPKMDEQSDICYASFRFSTNDCLKEEDDQDEVDNTKALVAVDQTPQKNTAIDPEVLDSTVKQVLDALRRAREQLQSSIEKRRVNTIRVG